MPSAEPIETFSTPRRLVARAAKIPERQSDFEELVMGPGSWGWVKAASRSMRHLARPEVLAKVHLPVFLLSTSGDRLVSPRASRRAASHLPQVEFVEMEPAARHEILRESDVYRDPALAAIGAFMGGLGRA